MNEQEREQARRLIKAAKQRTDLQPKQRMNLVRRIVHRLVVGNKPQPKQEQPK